MFLKELLNKLPSIEYSERLREIERFLSSPANRNNLDILELYNIIENTITFHHTQTCVRGEKSLLFQLLNYDKTRHLLATESDSAHINQLMRVDLEEAFNLCNGELAPYLLYDRESTTNCLFGFTEVKTLFVQADFNTHLFKHEGFSFYFEQSSNLTKQIFQEVDLDAKELILQSSMMTQCFSSVDFYQCLENLPRERLLPLICKREIAQRLKEPERIKLLLKLPESCFINGIANFEEFFSFLPEFNFSDSPLMERICAFSNETKVALLSCTDFMSAMPSDCLRVFINSLSMEHKLALLRNGSLITLLHHYGDYSREIDEIILSLLFQKELSDRLFLTEIFSILEYFHNDYLPMMNYLSHDLILSRLDESDELPLNLAELISRKFSYEQIYLFVKTGEYDHLYYDVFSPEVLKIFFMAFPHLATDILSVPMFVEEKLSVEFYNQIVFELSERFNHDEFYKKAMSSSHCRRVICDDPEAPAVLQIRNFILNSKLNEDGIIAIFKNAPHFIEKCSLDKWFEYLLAYYDNHENQAELALYLLADIVLKTQEVKNITSKVDLKELLRETSASLLAKLLLSEIDEVPTLIISKCQHIENFNPKLIPLIIEHTKGNQDEESHFLVERLLRLNSFSKDFFSAFSQAVLYIHSVSKNESIALILKFSQRKPISPLDWKLLITELIANHRQDVLSAMFFNTQIVEAMGCEALIFAMNKRVLTIEHLASFERDASLQMLLISESMQSFLRSPENEQARKVASQIPVCQKKMVRDQLFEDSWNNKAIKMPLAGIFSNDYVPANIRKMREAFARSDDLESIKKIAREAAANKRFWLWNSRRTEVQNFYEEVARLEKPLSEIKLMKAKELVHPEDYQETPLATHLNNQH